MTYGVQWVHDDNGRWNGAVVVVVAVVVGIIGRRQREILLELLISLSLLLSLGVRLRLDLSKSVSLCQSRRVYGSGVGVDSWSRVRGGGPEGVGDGVEGLGNTTTS